MNSTCVVLLLSVAILWRVNADVYTAIVEMEPLLLTHKRVFGDLEAYIQQEEMRLNFLKRQLNVYKEEHRLAMKDVSNYLGNPINAFTLIKRLTEDLDWIERNITRIGREFLKNVRIAQMNAMFPTTAAIMGVVQGIIRLQDTYRLNVTQMAEGMLNGVQCSRPLTTSDCFELGRSLYSLHDYHYARLWMQEALRKMDDGDGELQSFSRVDILEYIAFCYFLQEDIENALVWTRRLVAHAPDRARAAGTVPHYEVLAKNKTRRKQSPKKTDVESEAQELLPSPPPTKTRGAIITLAQSVFESLCRGDLATPLNITRRLKCRYMSENHPFLRLAPFKVEEVYLEPDIYLFHQVMGDREISIFKKMAASRLRRAKVQCVERGSIPSHYRIGKLAWLRDHEARSLRAITRRAADMTGLATGPESAEPLQVVNYGVGGHYAPHLDFTKMSDVAQGGATVFTELGLAVSPEKGAAVFWMNLHPSGEGDLATRHAACPVLRGSKWVATKWIRQRGQELLRPCGLEYQDESLERLLPSLMPVPKTHA